MDLVYKLKKGDTIKISDVCYQIIGINVIKMGKCFKDFYGNTWELSLIDDQDNRSIIKLNGKTIDGFPIEIIQSV